MKRNAGVVNLQIKDFRNWFNDYLKQEYDFTTKEAANYLGHSPGVNETHYEPISQERIISKVNGEKTAATNLLRSFNSFSEESYKPLETLAIWSGWRDSLLHPSPNSRLEKKGSNINQLKFGFHWCPNFGLIKTMTIINQN